MSNILRTNQFWRNVAGFIPAVVWALIVVVLSLSSASVIPGFSWASLTGIDKLGHLAFYCILALWMFYGFFRLSERHRYMALWTFLVCVTLGISMEILQGIMRMGRHFEYLDMAANTIGVLIAIGIYRFFLKHRYYGTQ